METCTADRLAIIIGESNVSAPRRESLSIAIGLGADDEMLRRLIAATRVCRRDTIVLPMQHLETLSRGRGWCKHGGGADVTWGERVHGGYRVGLQGLWIVCGCDGFARQKRVEWTVQRIQVGDQAWTIAD